jgi:lycopene cyclase domain-containing protein
MTYFGFLALFVVTPIGFLLGLLWRDRRNGVGQPAQFSNYAPHVVLAIHVAIALVYTTPWDNYLVATRVWWYDPALVTGLTIGWVPIEEYTFFLLQPILTGLWLLWLMRRKRLLDRPGRLPQSGLPHRSVIFLSGVWAVMIVILLVRWQPGTYLALELGWALPAIMLQLGFGADILWRHRRLLALALAPATLFLAAADALAIGAGTWTINPAQSLNLLLFGVLPVEEFIFFLITNVLIVFGVTLALAEESKERMAHFRSRLARTQPSASELG